MNELNPLESGLSERGVLAENRVFETDFDAEEENDLEWIEFVDKKGIKRKIFPLELGTWRFFGNVGLFICPECAKVADAAGLEGHSLECENYFYKQNGDGLKAVYRCCGLP